MRVKISFNSVLVSAFILIGSSCSYHNIDTPKVTPIVLPPGSWDRIGDFEGIPRENAVSFVIGSHAYVGTGYNAQADSSLSDFWQYDSAKDVWNRMLDFPGLGRHSAVAFALNGKGYVGMGTRDDINGLKDFYEFDPSVYPYGSWKKVADFVRERIGAIAFTVKDRSFVGTGQDSTGNNTTDLWEYDQASDGWIQRPDVGGAARSYAFVMVINDIAYVGGGLQPNYQSVLADVVPVILDFYMFDVTKLTSTPWQQKAMLPTTIQYVKSSTFTIDLFGYLTCGQTILLGNSGNTWKYDPALDVWSQCFSITLNQPQNGAARLGAVSFALGKYGYLGTGGQTTCCGLTPPMYDDFWKFDPDGVEPNDK